MKFDVVPVTRYEQNCSIVWCEATRAAAVIDPGGDIEQIEDFLAWEDLKAEVLLVTHGHFDHCGAAAALAERTGARIEGPHAAEAPLVQGVGGLPAKYGPARAYTPARWLDDGDVVTFGRETLQVLHCPGHTRGHVAYFSPAGRAAFVGDILFRHAIGAWEHADGDLPQLVASITGKLFPLGDDVRFVPGHGETSTFGHERRANPFVGEAAMARWRERRGRPAGLPAPGGGEIP
jgi:glyoxylase-like metal-dependent hydrolase (beta-lactamase superfamily II)